MGCFGFSAAAAAADYQVGFGPFIGGGRASDGSAVRHTSGYSISLERNFRPAPAAAPKLTLAPRFELMNSFVNTRETVAAGDSAGAGDGTYNSTYDNRIFAAGFSVGHDVGNAGTFAQGAYLTAMAGKGYTKLSVDESSDTRYRQLLWGGLSGNYFGGEIGAWIPFQGSFGINIAFLGSVYEAKLPDGMITQEGEEVRDGRSVQLTGSPDRDDLDFAETVYLKTFAAKVGVAVGF
jgi:hypothetical protein